MGHQMEPQIPVPNGTVPNGTTSPMSLNYIVKLNQMIYNILASDETRILTGHITRRDL